MNEKQLVSFLYIYEFLQFHTLLLKGKMGAALLGGGFSKLTIIGGLIACFSVEKDIKIAIPSF